MQTSHPFFADDYHIRWSTLTPDRVEADVDQALNHAETALDAIRNLDEAALTYDNTFAALETASEDLDRAWGRLNHLDSVNNSEEQRVALNAVLPKVSSFYSAIPLDAAIWAKLKAYSESPASAELNATRSRFVEETCASFIQSGAELPTDKKVRVSELDSRLSEITQKFSEHVLDSTNAWELIIDDPARLAGLPESAVAAALADAQSKGLGDDENPQWRITLQYPSMGPVMEYADDDALRKEIWQASNTVGNGGDYDNTDLIWEILQPRQEKAELLGLVILPISPLSGVWRVMVLRP